MAGKTNAELLAIREKHIPQGPFNITPLFVERAEGALVYDVEGREYIDFAGGIGVMNVGHGNEHVVSAIKEQVDQYIHTCFHVFMYEPYLNLAKKMNEITPGDFEKKTYFVNSGAEAAENAVKVARYATKRPAIIAFENGYHGRTYMAMSLTSKVKPYKFGFGPFCPEVYRMPFAYCYRCPFGREYPVCDVYCADHLENYFIGNVAPESVAALIAEPIQGEGGFIVPPPEYFTKIMAVCEKHGILFIMDEIQSGMGRTGKLFASEHFGVVPDIILSAKSLAAGLPLASITGKADIMEMPHVGGLGGTYSGNPVACRAALAVLDLLDDELLDKSEKLGQKVRDRFLALQEEFEIIGDVRGLGPMMGIELVKNRQTKEPAPDETKEVTARCLKEGVIVISCGNYSNVIRTLMPLVITDDQLDKGFSILRKALQEVSGT
ncbi:MAG: 4-aminobutyrate--2-oxoglutarate transaminase [Desulfobacteraceae bacterium]